MYSFSRMLYVGLVIENDVGNGMSKMAYLGIFWPIFTLVFSVRTRKVRFAENGILQQQ